MLAELVWVWVEECMSGMNIVYDFVLSCIRSVFCFGIYSVRGRELYIWSASIYLAGHQSKLASIDCAHVNVDQGDRNAATLQHARHTNICRSGQWRRGGPAMARCGRLNWR